MAPKAKKLRVTAIVEDVTIRPNDPEFKSRPEQPSMEHDVLQSLRKQGHDVQVIGIFDRIEPLVEGIEKNPPDLVFNLAEQFANDRRHDKHVAGILEMMDIPFTGTGSAGMLLSRDKALCKQLLATFKVRVPGFWVFPPGRAIHIPRQLAFPIVVKPAYGDGSEGISNASLVHDPISLKERVSWVHERFRQDAIAEEYIEGHEVYMGLLGNERPQVLPPYEIRFDAGNDSAANGIGYTGPVLATYRVKWNKTYREKWRIQFGFADLDKKLMERAATICRKAYRILQLRDYARIDLRITPREEIFILEANPNPDITQGEEMAEAARKAGMSYQRFISRIVKHALDRHGKNGRT